MSALVGCYRRSEWRRELLLEWWGAKRIIRLAHKHGMYQRAATARARMREIERLFFPGKVQS